MQQLIRSWFGEWQPYVRPRKVELADGAEDNGFALMLRDLLSQNVADHQAKARSLQKMHGRVAIVVEDAEVAVTLNFEAPTVTIHDGIVGIPDVSIRAPSERVTQMSLIELLPRVGVPDPRGEMASEIANASRSGEVQVFGALRHPATVLRLTEVLSVNA